MNAFVGCAITKAPSRVVEEVGEQPTRMSNNTWSTGPPPQRHSTNLITHLWRRKRLRGGRCRLHSYHPRVRHEPRISCSQVQTRKERPHHSTPLLSGHIVTNLVTNVRKALEGLPINLVHCWLDSTVVLHWIHGDGELKQFVGNHVRKIQATQT